MDTETRRLFVAGRGRSWRIVFHDQAFGPYDRATALATAARWALNARKQGHSVEVTVAERRHPSNRRPIAPAHPEPRPG